MITPLINQFVYRPDATFAPPGFTPADLGLTYEEVSLQAADGITLSGWYILAAKPRHALLYCHGNAGDIRDWVHATPPFVANGCNVFLFDYRGYGRSRGRPSEAGLYLDGEAVWSWLQARAEHEQLPAAILGKSLGSAVAIHVAAQTSPSRLILDSALTSMREVVAVNAPWLPRSVIPKLFESLPQLPQISCPTLVIHGRVDRLVPLAQGKAIFEALAGPKFLKIIDDAGHNDITSFPDYHRWISYFLEDLEAMS